MRFDFPTIMVLLVLVSGGIWAFDTFVLARRRRLAGARAEQGAGEKEEVEERHPPKVVEYARSFFPVFLIVLALRSFVVEPFRIPSASMMPTLLVGDFILVNKFIYGIRLPITNTEVLDVSRPERGDVIVFRYPEDPAIPFIKRVVGLPGDHIAYTHKTLYINGKPAEQENVGTFHGKWSGRSMTGASLRVEDLGSREHRILVQPGSHSVQGQMIVPDGHYFVLGDNRDNSRDSRYWGTVPDEYLIGEAFTIWMHWDWGHGIDLGRIGMSIE
ncbi:MAG: signal peptidase I [Gammaproteobacteria bacterium]|nr:signal peptidase I [Gammaproteobacteria bacterium]NIR85694.1 signal peptidase I [Gammaproteobacteria bacterium]NIR90227.1 signal peptidase I [Gammaproteobacteria bacterium]NIU06828.1 signal peptidase I [Gammaproteobacteria bacterium]NIV53761.1 signal peptidase I [Gammaproteobacteria bacterium]